MDFEVDLTTETGRKWAALMGKARTKGDKPRRAKRFTGDHSQHKAWVREMGVGPGVFLPTGRIPNWLNFRMHHHAKADLARNQHATAYVETRAWTGRNRHKLAPPPYLVTLTRYGPKVLDDDGLAASLKYFRDGVAQALGIDDGKTDLLRFVSQQEVAKWYGVRIQVEPAPRPVAGAGAAEETVRA